MSYISFLNIGQEWKRKDDEYKDVIHNFYVQQKWRKDNPVSFVYQKIIMKSGLKLSSSRLLSEWIFVKDQ